MGSVIVCSRTWETNLKQSCFSDPEVQGIPVAKNHNKDIVECALIGQKQKYMEIIAGSQPVSGGVRHSFCSAQTTFFYLFPEVILGLKTEVE